MKIDHRLCRITQSLQICLVVMVWLLVSAMPSFGHAIGQSYIFLKIYQDGVEGRFEITMDDVTTILTPQSEGPPATAANLAEHIDEIHDYYQKKVRFTDGKEILPIHFTSWEIMNLDFADYVLMDFRIVENRPPPDIIDVDYSVMFDENSDHLAFLVIEHFWQAGIFNNERNISLYFNPNERQQQLKVADYSVFHGFVAVVKSGVRHILIGIDHILFLIALMLPAALLRKDKDWLPVDKFRPAIIYVIKIVTLFTIAHSITLSLAALDIITLPSRLVESVIALSIAIAALDILFPIFHHRIGWVVFVFGLFYGLGLASVIKHLGILGENTALSLLGFNTGVVIGQIAVICIIFPVLFNLRTYALYPRFIMRFGAAALIMVAFVWFVERSFLEISFIEIARASLFYL